MAVPRHYRAFCVYFIRFSLIMLVIGGFVGVLYQEMTGKIRFADVPPGMHIETGYRLAVIHGHFFLIGAVMPIVWITILKVVHELGGRPVGERALDWIRGTYSVGAVSVTALLLYKGLHYVIEVKKGERDFDKIHAGIFGGVRWIRAVAYASSHTIATVALVLFAVVVWRALSSRRED